MPKPLPGNILVGTSGDDTLDRRGYTDDWKIDGRAGNDIFTAAAATTVSLEVAAMT